MPQSFLKEILKLQKPGIISHIHPDGDAIGSQLALYHLLRPFGISPLLFNQDPIPANISWLSELGRIKVPDLDALNSCDGYIFVDGNVPSRFGTFADFFQSTEKPVFLIDHHLDLLPDFFKATLWDPTASSTAFLVYKLFEEAGLHRLTKEACEALYCGILTDTGSFRFDTVTAETHFAIGEIIRRGALQPAAIYDLIYESRSIAEYQLLGMALNTLRLYCDKKAGIITVSREMMSKTGCRREHLEGFVNYPLGIKGVGVSVMLYEEGDRVKISFRGKSLIDLNELAHHFEGGGHYNAAGGWHEGPLSVAASAIVAAINERLEKKSQSSK